MKTSLYNFMKLSIKFPFEFSKFISIKMFSNIIKCLINQTKKKDLFTKIWLQSIADQHSPIQVIVQIIQVIRRTYKSQLKINFYIIIQQKFKNIFQISKLKLSAHLKWLDNTTQFKQNQLKILLKSYTNICQLCKILFIQLVFLNQL
ncbi:unnamed protein product [Paramecium primaurelia]|uniref:Uncharacterized protein n=1 Tax=Paramecium primaurelia TaxID=5886 RepID=A0A8S1QVJ0_PARPR|nr:unnamed protein product [Paramecium primaurelia]